MEQKQEFRSKETVDRCRSMALQLLRDAAWAMQAMADEEETRRRSSTGPGPSSLLGTSKTLTQASHCQSSPRSSEGTQEQVKVHIPDRVAGGPHLGHAVRQLFLLEDGIDGDKTCGNMNEEEAGDAKLRPGEVLKWHSSCTGCRWKRGSRA